MLHPNCPRQIDPNSRGGGVTWGVVCGAMIKWVTLGNGLLFMYSMKVPRTSGLIFNNIFKKLSQIFPYIYNEVIFHWKCFNLIPTKIYFSCISVNRISLNSLFPKFSAPLPPKICCYVSQISPSLWNWVFPTSLGKDLLNISEMDISPCYTE